jgi:hypothetical protein
VKALLACIEPKRSPQCPGNTEEESAELQGSVQADPSLNDLRILEYKNHLQLNSLAVTPEEAFPGGELSRQRDGTSKSPGGEGPGYSLFLGRLERKAKHEGPIADT